MAPAAIIPGMDPKYAAMGYQQSMAYGISTINPDIYKMNPAYAYPTAISPAGYPVMYSNYPMSSMGATSAGSGGSGGAPSPTSSNGTRGYSAASMGSPSGSTGMTDSNGNTYVRGSADYLTSKSYYSNSGQYSPIPASNATQAHSQQPQAVRYPSPDETRIASSVVTQTTENSIISGSAMIQKAVNGENSPSPPNYPSTNVPGRHWTGGQPQEMNR